MQVGPTLQEGSSGEAVEVLQRALQRAGFDPGPIDGEFGPLTAEAVRSFQAARGLVVDGIVGPQTWSALEGDATMPCANADTPATQLTQAAAEEAVLCLINEQRAANGVPALTLNPKLRTAARLHAQAANEIKWWPSTGGSIVHTNPVTGSTPESRIREAGYCPGALPPTGENAFNAFFFAGGNQAGTAPREAIEFWVGSAGHRANLLNPAFRESGVGVVLGIPTQGLNAAGGAIFVQTFGGCSVPG